VKAGSGGAGMPTQCSQRTDPRSGDLGCAVGVPAAMLEPMRKTGREEQGDPVWNGPGGPGGPGGECGAQKRSPCAADPPGREGPPSRPPGRPPVDPSREIDRGLATKQRPKVERPPRFKVILYNDDYTPMEFVVRVLETVFGKSPSAATQIMLQIHRSGMGVGGVYVLEVAETKSATVLRMAEERGYPLRSGVEKE